MSENQILINGLSKVFDNGFNALKNINLKVKQSLDAKKKVLATIKREVKALTIAKEAVRVMSE